MLLGMLLTVARAALGFAQPWRQTGGVKVRLNQRFALGPP
jgi:hypothetical protein